MNKFAMSPTAASLVRALLSRAAVARNAVLLTHYRSVEWRSLTFDGERHEIGVRIPAPDAAAVVARMMEGLDDAEFTIAGQVVADIAIAEGPTGHVDGSISLTFEALTIAA